MKDGGCCPKWWEFTTEEKPKNGGEVIREDVKGCGDSQDIMLHLLTQILMTHNRVPAEIGAMRQEQQELMVGLAKGVQHALVARQGPKILTP